MGNDDPPQCPEAESVRSRVVKAIADLRAFASRHNASAGALMSQARQLLDEYYLDLDLSVARLYGLSLEERPDLSDFDDACPRCGGRQLAGGVCADSACDAKDLYRGWGLDSY